MRPPGGEPAIKTCARPPVARRGLPARLLLIQAAFQLTRAAVRRAQLRPLSTCLRRRALRGARPVAVAEVRADGPCRRGTCRANRATRRPIGTRCPRARARAALFGRAYSELHVPSLHLRPQALPVQTTRDPQRKHHAALLPAHAQRCAHPRRRHARARTPPPPRPAPAAREDERRKQQQRRDGGRARVAVQRARAARNRNSESTARIVFCRNV